MPRQQGLLRRRTRWFSNIKVPKDLWAALGKTHFRDALGTSDYREACQKIAYEKSRLTALFDLTRKKMTSLSAVPAPKQKRQLTVLSKSEAHELACRYFVSQEGEFQRWMDNEGRQLDPQKLEDGDGPSNSQMNQYGRGQSFLRTLAEDLAQVEYPGLDLSHLHAMPNANMSSPPDGQEDIAMQVHVSAKRRSAGIELRNHRFHRLGDLMFRCGGRIKPLLFESNGEGFRVCP